MRELLDKINATFDNSINTSSEEVALQLKILKGNINTLFNEAMKEDLNSQVVENTSDNVEISSKKKVLIVDDSSIIRNYLQKTVSTEYDVILSGGGEDAIRVLDGENSIDLILLDLMMPGVDGFGVLEHLKEKNYNIPVIIISGDTTKETIDRAFTYKVYDMIEKPFSDKVILEKINRILE